MLYMDPSTLAEEAERCRLQALSYLGTDEASLLLRVAREFDHLAQKIRFFDVPASTAHH
jgi:hypothetical protein